MKHFDDRNVRKLYAELCRRGGGASLGYKSSPGESCTKTVNWSLMNSNKENLSLLLSFLGHVDLQECELDPGMP